MAESNELARDAYPPFRRVRAPFGESVLPPVTCGGACCGDCCGGFLPVTGETVAGEGLIAVLGESVRVLSGRHAGPAIASAAREATARPYAGKREK
jgi:hypothetical protein